MIDPQDIIPVSELHGKLRAALDQTERTGRPIIVTKRGRPAGVLLDVAVYQRLVELAERAELEEMVARGERALGAGSALDWEGVKRERLAWLLER